MFTLEGSARYRPLCASATYVEAHHGEADERGSQDDFDTAFRVSCFEQSYCEQPGLIKIALY